MRLLLAVAFLFPAVQVASAFVHHVRSSGSRRGSVVLNMSEEQPEKKKQTSADILARARKAAGMPEEEPPPKLFEDDLLDDMQQSLRKLEKRVKEGPGSLSVDEVENFEAATKRILDEMKEKLNGAAPKGAPSSFVDVVATPVAASPPVATPPAPAPPMKRVEETIASAPAQPAPEAPVDQQTEVMDTSNDETPAYDGKGGMGLAKGTRNTYDIPGMDEMSPEEYRKALQKSVSDRQSRRKDGAGGVVGNRAALQYLDQLGWGGASSNWKANEDQ